MKKSSYIEFIRNIKTEIVIEDYDEVYRLVQECIDDDNDFKRADEYLKSIGVLDTAARIADDLR